MKTRKVLFIAYHFPPIGGSGVQRPAKFVKYLPQFGWQPYVIAADQDEVQGTDTTLLADIPSVVPVWRVSTPRPQPVKRLAKFVGWQSVPGLGPAESFGFAPGRATSPGLSLAKRLRRAILSPLTLVENPLIDDKLYWSLRIVPLARRIIRQENIDAILTTSPPWSPALAGALLQELTGRPWICDARDPWTDNSFTYHNTGLRHRFDRLAENRVLQHAAAVVSVTEPVLDMLKEKVFQKDRAKPFLTIPNGFDRDDFVDGYVDVGDMPVRERHRITFLHPGQAYQGVILPLLAALEQLRYNENLVERLFFHFVGHIHPADVQAIRNSAFSHLFSLDLERIPHPDAIALMKAADVLLLLLRGGPEASSGKVYEYMATGVPALAIASGVGADLIHRSGIGCAIDPDNIVRLAQILGQIAQDYDSFRRQFYHPDAEYISQYDRRMVTKQLANLLDHVVDATST
ncbi:MAG: glycosyltransferase [Nitrosomonas ureae]